MGAQSLQWNRRSWIAAIGIGMLALASSVMASELGSISGKVIDRKTKAPVAQALVILTCSCLLEARTTLTDDNGEYRFASLEAGTYMVQVLDKDADVQDTVTLPPSAELRVDFRIEPNGSLGDG